MTNIENTILYKIFKLFFHNQHRVVLGIIKIALPMLQESSCPWVISKQTPMAALQLEGLS